MAQINDYRQISNATGGYTPGKIYIYSPHISGNEKYKSVDRWGGNENKGLYDTDSGNFHIIANEYIECSECVKISRDSIYEYFEKKIKEKIEKSELKGKFELTNEGQKGGTEHLSVEKCICVKYNGSLYLLCFERLYVHKMKVNCMFGLLQFYKTTDKQYINKQNKVFDMCYPNSFQDGKKRMNKFNHIVYNPCNLMSIMELNSIEDTYKKNQELEKIYQAFESFIRNV